MNNHEKFANLTPLSDHVQGYPGSILVSPEVIGCIGAGTTDAFKEAEGNYNSATYDERYFRKDAQTAVLIRSMDAFPDFDRSAVTDILDIGCGSGNATFAILDLMPESVVYATDISPDMVAILAERTRKWNKAHRVIPIVSDAEKVMLKPESFDLIVGSSMVHHLMEPDLFLDRVLAALKPGGLCYFNEPFKAGHQIMRLFLDEMSSSSPYSKNIPQDIKDFFQSYIFTIDAMCTLDRSKIDYAAIDDKWMFPRSFFANAAARNNAHYASFTNNQTKQRFQADIEHLVWLGLGQKWAIPEPALSFVRRFDDALPSDVIDEFSSSACVVFKKDK
jgi:SAM-dependent methyltransferase